MREILGKYHIDGLIAEGGMARIYRAKTEGVGGIEKVVALKCLKGAMSEDDQFVQMLMDEARITVCMTHKNIGQVYGLEHDANTYFMVMELIDGVTLADLSNYLFSRNRIFPMEAAVFIALEVCSGLSYAHRMTDAEGMPLGIVHRDVNPQNICISKEGEIKLIDFGIAKARRASTETQAGTIKGKFNYMSPEQARGDRVDQRTDVFALGAVLYEMLCGHMLYPLTLDDMRLRQKTRMADFIPIENYLPDIPETLRRILAKALARDVNQRFATSRDFLLALTQFFHDSCKVYDSLNLSMLVEKYLENKSASELKKVRLEERSAPRFQSYAPRFRNGASRDFEAESSDTAVMTAQEARRIATSADAEEDNDGATAIYEQPNFSQGMPYPSTPTVTDFQGNASLSGDMRLSRSVDLDIADTASQSTVMVNMKDVKAPRGFRWKSFADRLYARFLKISEKTLVIVALVLILLLIIAILLFWMLTT